MLPRETSYIILFLILSLTGLGVVAWIEVRQAAADNFVDTSRAILNGIESVVVVSAAFTYIIIEGLRMLAERYEKRRYQEGRADGLTEGRAEGLTKGRAETFAEWQSWNDRRMSAERKGEPFDEPPPSLNGTASAG